MHTSLQNIQVDLNNEIQNKVNEINSIASEIATLNKQINTIEVNHVKANELRDKRNLLVDQLSNIVDVKITEIPIYTTEGGTEESGIYRYIVDIAGGQNLVNSYEYSTLECVARNGDEKVNQSDADGLYDIYLTGLPLNLYGGSLGGQLKGLIEMRDGNNGENFSAKGAFVTTTDNTVTVKIDKTNPNHDFLTDMNKVTMNSSGTIVVGNKGLVYDSWQYDSQTETYTFHLDETKTNNSGSGLSGKDAYIGVNIDYQGIPYYMAQMNEWVRSFAQAMNKIERTAQTAMNGTAPTYAESMFTCGSDESKFNAFDYNEAAGVVYDDGGKTVTFSNIDDPSAMFSYKDNYLHLTAGNFNINSSMIKDVSLFGTTADYMSGRDAQDVTKLLMEVRTDKSKMTYRGCSSEEFLQCLTSDVALGASSANNFYSNFDKISNAIIAQRTSVSGVDNDEEALNLVKFQEAYNLSSKMIQVMTEIYDRLILQTGV
ncbi:MAG: flagellar hook-associated protein FlgK, partial [Lachnospiraceae bacterium]|nr:flagellar hook-associated protein FlgK [Lachnospiraceae bacterium]